VLFGQFQIFKARFLFFLQLSAYHPRMKKRVYGKWEPQDMLKALKEFRKGKLKLNECCRKYDIPKKTFLRHLKGQVKRGTARSTKSVNGREAALPMEADKEQIEEYCILRNACLD
jgi:hypothetical protein